MAGEALVPALRSGGGAEEVNKWGQVERCGERAQFVFLRAVTDERQVGCGGAWAGFRRGLGGVWEGFGSVLEGFGDAWGTDWDCLGTNWG